MAAADEVVAPEESALALVLSGGKLVSLPGTLVLGSLTLLELMLLEVEELGAELLVLLEVLLELEVVPLVEHPPVQPVIPRARTKTAAVSRTAKRFVFI